MLSIIANLFNIRIGPISQKLDRHHGHCWHCGTTWTFVRPHKLQYTEYAFEYVLCEGCHRELSLDERLRYYRQDWDRGNERWQAHCLRHWGKIIGDGTGWTKWTDIETAVRAEK